MRIPAAASLQTRDGQLARDAKVTNGLIEMGGESLRLRKRPGSSVFSFVKTGLAQLLISWNGIRTVIGDYFNSGFTPSGSYTNSTTWNPADKSANVTLSGGNLTTAWTSVAIGGVRSVASLSSGLWYFEVTINTLGSPFIGFCSALQALDLSGGNYRTNYLPAAGVIYGASGTITSVPTSIAGDIVGALYDVSNTTIVFYKNGVSIGSISGADVPAGPLFAMVISNGSAATNLTANFAGPFAFSPSASSTALVITSGLLPFSGAFNGENATTPYLMISNAEFAWAINNSGTITKVADVDYPGNQTPPRRTVLGIVYLDGYFLVADTKGVVYNSGADDPTSWSALGFITANFENGAGMALAKSQEYVAFFKEYSVELLYDAANPIGSPLSPVQNGFIKIGCASGASLADIKGQIFWVSQSKQKGRSVHVMVGTSVAEVATPDVQRVLNNDDLATVYAIGARIDGHDLYILTLVSSNVTLVYDLTTKTWVTWSSYTSRVIDTSAGANVNTTGTTAIFFFAGGHDLSDGDPVFMSGWDQPEYNGYHQITYISPTSFSFPVAAGTVTPGTGTCVLTVFDESYFKYTKYTSYQGVDLFLHETDGYLYTMQPLIYQDNILPINFVMRSQRLDGGTSNYKFMGSLRLVGEQVLDTCMIRRTDDDYQTYNAYRIINLNTDNPQSYRWGKFRRRALEMKHIGNSRPVFDAIELEVK